MTVLLLVFLLTILVCFHCGLIEAVLYSTRMGTLEAARAAGRRPALTARLIEMKRNIAAPISAILVLNTVANTVGPTAAGVLAVDVLGGATLPVVSVVFSLGILFFGEIMPKTIGALHWRKLWPIIVLPLTFYTKVLYPIVWATQRLSNLFTRGPRSPHITEEEILAAVRMGATEGQITARESDLVHNIIDLENKAIQDIMTPRTVVFSLDAGMTAGEALKAVDQKGFTRIPLYEGDRENIIGYMLIHDLYSAKTLSKPDEPIRYLAKPITFVPETNDALALLAVFLRQRRHIAVVVDEYGGVAGLVTLEDLIETLLGREIVDETDRDVDLQERARRLGKQRPSDLP